MFSAVWLTTVRSRPSAKHKPKEVCQQTDPGIPVVLVSAEAQIEETGSPVVESPVVTGTASCWVAVDMQTGLLAKTLFLSAATDAEAWQGRPAVACAICRRCSAELANPVSQWVVELQHVVRRVGLVCPRHSGRHHVVARTVTDATNTRCPTLCLRSAKFWRAASHATFASVGNAWPTTLEEVTMVLLVLAAPEGRVHTLPFVVELLVVTACNGHLQSPKGLV